MQAQRQKEPVKGIHFFSEQSDQWHGSSAVRKKIRLT